VASSSSKRSKGVNKPTRHQLLHAKARLVPVIGSKLIDLALPMDIYFQPVTCDTAQFSMILYIRNRVISYLLQLFLSRDASRILTQNIMCVNIAVITLTCQKFLLKLHPVPLTDWPLALLRRVERYKRVCGCRSCLVPRLQNIVRKSKNASQGTYA